MELIYVGSHPAVECRHLFAGAAERHGAPVEVQDRDAALSLIARGDWVEFKPEPRKPVQRTRE
jgi:hypothetical protein